MDISLFVIWRFFTLLVTASVTTNFWVRANDVFFMTDVQLNKFNEPSLKITDVNLDLSCRNECFKPGDVSCNACVYDEENGVCELYFLSGYFNKMLRIGETDETMTSHKHWAFKYAQEDPGWNIVLKRVFADIDFSNATWDEMVEGIGGGEGKDEWVGLAKLNSLTTNGKNTLRLKFSKNNVIKQVTYSNFVVASEENGFQYSVGTYSTGAGTAAYHDCMGAQQGNAFLTPDIAPAGTSQGDMNKLPNWFNPAGCCHFNWFGVMDSGNGDDVTCDGASSGGMVECLSVCADSDPALLDYLIVQVQ